MNSNSTQTDKVFVGNNKKTKSDAAIEKYEHKFIEIQQEINQLKIKLNEKYQELNDLQNEIADKKRVKSKINPQIGSLNELKINLPNFLIVGVQKGGTTWLHKNLKQHPQIFLPEGRKELEFFSYYQKKTESSGLSKYFMSFNQFQDVIRGDQPKAIGEATPSYFWSINPGREWTNAPQYFNDQIPDSVLNVLGSKLKLIVCLRDPVERAISAYFHHIKRDRFSYKSQSIFDVGHLYGIIDMGFYQQHLNAWLEKFSLDNFKILIYERDIKQNKQRTIENICKFLGVEHQLFPDSINLNEYHNRGLKYRIEENGVFLVFPDSDEKLIVINRDELKQLRDIYRDDYINLQNTLNLDLSKYWNFE